MTHTVHGKPVAPVLGALLLASLGYALSQTMVAPALPHLAQTYDTTSSTTAWVLTGYLLSASVCTPLAGSSATSSARAACSRTCSRSSASGRSSAPRPAR